DVEAFARTINMLLFSESRRKELGQNGISWASNFTWRKSTDKLIKSVHDYIALNKKYELVFEALQNTLNTEETRGAVYDNE
ncbi:MAG TPA: hypothetical protein VLI92_04080, partial [Candidatus Saccharimonadales bacterium]|nr:hypothetical protein [Candidatus Saccharimonadales bacterium]